MELTNLAADQRRDDTPYQDPQRFAGKRTVSRDEFNLLDRDGDDLETVRDSAGSSAARVGGVVGPLMKWGPSRVHPLYRPRTGREREALSIAVEPFLKNLTIPQWDAVRLVVFGRLSQRQTANVLGVTQPAIFKRLRAAAASLQPVIEQRSGSAGFEFPPTRAFDEGDTCRVRPRDGYAHKCDGHFAPAVCGADCITILPRHYNSHTTCRVHTRGKPTRYEFNLAWLIGVGLRHLGGQTRRTRSPVRGRPNRKGGAA